MFCQMRTDDMDLVREYAQRHSEEAFATLVSRHINLVYSVALLRARDVHLAEEITQATFIILARKANSLGPKTILPGWLCRTAHFVGAKARTMQQRRQIREQEAYMQSVLTEPESPAWSQLAPLLDTALGQLGEKDHDAIVLRFFQNKSLSEIGLALGTSEDSAKKRVSRALEKLRKFFTKRGVVSTVTALEGVISTNCMQVAPAALARAVTAAAFSKGAAAGGSTLALMKGALKLMTWSQVKTTVVLGAAAILTTGATEVIVNETSSPALAAVDNSNEPGAGFLGVMALYHKIVGSTIAEWSRYPYIAGTDSSFQARLATLVTNAGRAGSLTAPQSAGLTNELMTFFKAYNSGTYDAYKAFRMPAEVSFELQTNGHGNSLVSTLRREPGGLVAQPKALDRWWLEVRGKAVDWDSQSVDEQFLAYVKLYSGDALFSNYLAGISFDHSRIILSQFKADPIPGATETEFSPAKPVGTMVSESKGFPNMGYFSQRSQTFIKFKDTMEDTRLAYGAVTVADCLLFCRRNNPESPLPLILRLYWEPKAARWLPADVVICNMEDKGDYWPVF
jgi:RNA polymerase sigma factor (sigma-70 family)